MGQADTAEPSGLEKLLGLFTDVKGGEGGSALLLTLNVFLLLCSYYIIKPVREALINAMPNGPEYKSYMGGAIAIALLFAVPAYVAYSKKVSRNKLVVGVTLFFVSHVVLFAFATKIPGSEQWLGLAFYLWVGIFNMMVVAQFWAFANDIYNEEQGKRLFALIGIGASAGAAVGGALAKWLPLRPVASLGGACDATTNTVGYLGTFGLLLVAAGMLAMCALISQVVHNRESMPKPEKVDAKLRNQLKNTMAASSEDLREQIDAQLKKDKAREQAKDEGAFQMVFRYRYLLLLAAFSLTFTLVNTNGEYILSKLVKKHVFEIVNACQFTDGAVKGAFIKGMFTSWYGDFFFYVNIAGVALQSFAVSRLVKFGGLRVAFFVLPVIATLGAISVVVMPMLYVLRVSKIAENSTDYSVNNTVRNMLWLPTTKAMKYRAKQAVDTFFVRMGDVGSALIVFVVSLFLDPGATDPGVNTIVRIFAGLNALLLCVWFYIAIQIIKEQKVLKKMKDDGEFGDDDAEAATE